MKQKLLSFLLLCMALMGSAHAQDRRISGQVTAVGSGEPISGVSVLVNGTNTGTTTNRNGNYSLSVPDGAKSITFRFIGYSELTLPLGASNTLNAALTETSSELSEVVVTAMGITRSERSLGYSATTIKGDDIAGTRNTNMVNTMAGRVAGVQINSVSSDPGSAASVVIRGYSSINGSNQALYVVDGVPLQSNSFMSDGHVAAISGAGNIAPDDIESVTVLKGAAATALYGSRAANGVVVITTKKGTKGSDHNYTLQYNGGLQLRQVSLMPDMQNEFGQGWNGTQTYIENASWGPRLDGSRQVYGPIYDHQQLIHTYSAVKNNVRDFFDIGKSWNHNISLSGASDDNKITNYLSYSYSKDDGIMPTDADAYNRNTIAYRTTYQGADWFKISSSVNFAKARTNTVGVFQGTSVIDGLYEFPRDVSLVDKQDLTSPFNNPQAYFTPYGITNPYWSLANNYNQLNSKQVYGKVQADINPIKELTLTYRFGYDYSDYDTKIGVPQIEIPEDDPLMNNDYGWGYFNMNQDGSVYARYGKSYELNHDFLATYDNKFDKLSVTAIAGANINERYSTYMLGETQGLAFQTGFWDLSNGSNRTDLSEAQSKRRLIGALADVTLGWDDYLYLNLTARNDWSSTLPTDRKSFFYPGATLGWIFTENLPKNNILTYGKARLAYGKTGNDASPYQIYNTFTQAFANGYYAGSIASFPFNGINSFQSDATAGSATLQPEMTREFEAGLELKFFNNRIGLDAAFYNRKTSDQIFTLPVDPATGYNNLVTNFGEVQNKGIELLLTGTPVQTEKFRWDLGVNLTVNRNKVLSVPVSLEDGIVNINSYSAGNDAVYMRAVVGKPLGQYYTYLAQHVTDQDSPYYGAPIVDADGQPVLNTEVEDTGLGINPKWTGGATTSLSAYGFTLSAALDVRYGGTTFSRTKNLMEFTGNGVITLYNDRRPFVVPNSVVDNGDGTYSENSTPIYLGNTGTQNYFDKVGWGNGGLAYLTDRTFAKLRNITLTYNLPKKWVNSTYLSNIAVSAFVNNAFIWTASDNYYIDPEGSTEGSDLDGMFGEMYINPSTRIYGLNVSFKF